MVPLGHERILYYGIRLKTCDRLRVLSQVMGGCGGPIRLAFGSLCCLPRRCPRVKSVVRGYVKVKFQDCVVTSPTLLICLGGEKVSYRVRLDKRAKRIGDRVLGVFQHFPLGELVFRQGGAFQSVRSIVTSRERIRGRTKVQPRTKVRFRTFILGRVYRFAKTFYGSLRYSRVKCLYEISC